MLKLLTDEERDKVAGEYLVRRGIIIMLSLVLVVVIGVVSLMPAYILSNLREREAVDRAKIMSTSADKDSGTELKAWLLETNRRLTLLSPELDVDRPSDFVLEMLNLKLSGIKITGLSWLRVKDKISLSVNGVAVDRQTLVRFEDRINSSELFSDVTLPISDLAKDKDISFQIKFSPK